MSHDSSVFFAQDGSVSAADLSELIITFGTMTIPEKRATNITERDRVEADFLSWREVAMPQRRSEQNGK